MALKNLSVDKYIFSILVKILTMFLCVCFLILHSNLWLRDASEMFFKAWQPLRCCFSWILSNHMQLVEMRLKEIKPSHLKRLTKSDIFVLSQHASNKTKLKIKSISKDIFIPKTYLYNLRKCLAKLSVVVNLCDVNTLEARAGWLRIWGHPYV